MVIALGNPSGGGTTAAARVSVGPTSTARPSAAPKVSPSAHSTASTRWTPTQQLDALGQANEFVGFFGMADTTDYRPDLAGQSVAQALAMRAASAKSGADGLRAGMPVLCPKWTKTLKASLSGRYDRWITEDTYDIGAGPWQIPSGTYRTTGDIADCYWERTAANGDVIDNGLVTAARRITVHISTFDSTFTSDNCGVWTPVH